MARKPSHSFGSRPPQKSLAAKPRNPFAPQKPSSVPAQRKTGFEKSLCDAIRAELIVELWYDRDMAPRAYEPEVVYHSSKGKICVDGRLVVQGGSVPHTFEVGKIARLTVTDRKFRRDPRFQLSNSKYRHRVCPL